MTQANAWVLDLGEGLQVAVGVYELVHIIEAPRIFPVPVAPAYFYGASLWQGEPLPIMDLSRRLSTHCGTQAPSLIAVTVYHDPGSETLRYGGIGLSIKPRQETVCDAQQCALPEEFPRWRDFAISCFSDGATHPIPILDVSAAFSRAIT